MLSFIINTFQELPKIEGKKPDFKLITSFAPAGVYEKLKNYTNEGDIFFKGIIKGETIGKLPKIDLQFGCSQAQFINPDGKNNSIRNLNLVGFFTNGEKRDLSTSELFVKNLTANPAEGTFKGNFHIKNFQNPFVSVDVHSDLDLSSLQNFFDIPALKGLQGRLLIDMTVDELLDYNRVPAMLGKLKDGTDSRLVLKNVKYKPANYPHTMLLDGKVEIKNGTLMAKNLALKVGNSDLNLSGEITNLSAFLHGRESEIEAIVKGNARKIDIGNLLKHQPKLAAKYDEQVSDLKFDLAFKTNSTYLRGAAGVPRGEFLVKNLFMKLKNYPHTIHDWHLDVLVNENEIRTKLFEGFADQTDFHLLGFVKNYQALFDTLKSNQKIDASVYVRSNLVDFKNLFTYKNKNYLPEAYQNEVVKNFVFDAAVQLPAKNLLNGQYFDNTQVHLRMLDGIFKLHNYQIREVSGKMIALRNSLKVVDWKGKIGKSDFLVNANIEDITKLKAKDYSGKKEIKIQSSLLDIDQFLTIPANASQSKEIRPAENATNHGEAFNIFTVQFPNLHLEANIGRLLYKKFDLQQTQAQLRIQPNRMVYVDNFVTQTAGGTVAMKGYFSGLDPQKIYFQNTITAQNIDLGRVFYKMDNFGQDYLISENIQGKASGTIKSKVLLHPDGVVNLSGTEAHVEAKISDGRLTNFPPFRMLDQFMGDKDLENVRFGELNNVFDVKNGNMSIPKMEISSTLGYMLVSGAQNLDKDKAMKYTVQVPVSLIKKKMWNYFFTAKKKNTPAPSETTEEIVSSETMQSRRFAVIDIFGTPEKFDFDFKGMKRNAKKEKL